MKGADEPALDISVPSTNSAVRGSEAGGCTQSVG